jgi:hypothetical protein
VLVGPERARVRAEWDCFARYACVRGLFVSGGFTRETAVAIDALHEEVLAGSASRSESSSAPLAERYAEYGAIGQAGGSAGAATVTRRLGEAAARHVRLRAGGAAPEPALAELLGRLHESVVEAATATVRTAT